MLSPAEGDRIETSLRQINFPNPRVKRRITRMLDDHNDLWHKVNFVRCYLTGMEVLGKDDIALLLDSLK